MIVVLVGLAIAFVNAVAACTAAAGIWFGIRAMVRANKERAGILDQQREADERRHDEAMRRHDEAMHRHDEVMRHHDEAMRAGDQRHAEAMAALNELIQAGQRQHEATMRALETVIERTAPGGLPGRSQPH